MSDQKSRVLQTAAELRQAFDGAFAVPAQAQVRDNEAFLAIRVTGRPYVLRVAELSRLEQSRKIVSLPGGKSTLLGLAGIQGRLTPVYSLATILNLGPSTGERRWIAVCGRGEELLGLAFEEFERFLQIPKTDIIIGGAGEAAGQPSQQAIREADTVRPILYLPSLLARVRRQAGISGEVSTGS